MTKLWNWLKSLIIIIIHRPGPKKRKAGAVGRGKGVEESGQWYFKRNILDQLDEYHLCIKRMKKTDPDGFKMYSRVGATVVSPKTMMQQFLSPVWKDPENRPSFGAVAILCEPDKDDWYGMKFGYFRRIDKVPVTVEPSSSHNQVYEIVVFHTRVDDTTRWGRISSNFFVEVAPNAQIRALRSVVSRKQTIHHKDRAGGNTVLFHRKWAYSAFLDNDDHPGTPQKKAAALFAIIATGYEHASMGLRISATRRGVTAMFGVDLLRTPYFFDDREATYTDKGAKKRIFHIVRTHPRTLADGRVIPVKSHFRGEREFDWNGHRVIISMPGHHHAPLTDYRGGAHIFEADEQWPPGMISEDEMAKKVRHHLKGDHWR